MLQTRLGRKATHRTDVADGISCCGIRFAIGAVDRSGDLSSPFGISSSVTKYHKIQYKYDALHKKNGVRDDSGPFVLRRILKIYRMLCWIVLARPVQHCTGVSLTEKFNLARMPC